MLTVCTKLCLRRKLLVGGHLSTQVMSHHLSVHQKKWNCVHVPSIQSACPVKVNGDHKQTVLAQSFIEEMKEKRFVQSPPKNKSEGVFACTFYIPGIQGGDLHANSTRQFLIGLFFNDQNVIGLLSLTPSVTPSTQCWVMDRRGILPRIHTHTLIIWSLHDICVYGHKHTVSLFYLWQCESFAPDHLKQCSWKYIKLIVLH